MQIVWSLLGFLCWSIPILSAHPVSSLTAPELRGDAVEAHASGWFEYVLGLSAVLVVTFTIIGCLCCKRHHHPKGFQETEVTLNQEFKDGHTSSGCDLAFENPVSGLELEVSPAGSQLERICFEPLPLNCVASPSNSCSTPKPKIPHSTPLTLDQNWSLPVDSCNEWFNSSIHVSREKLKYLREIGHGWFGKVVEGWLDVDATNDAENIAQNKGVIVRILTEEATSEEKSWFLREATPYLKLRHRNILALLGSCLETDPYLLLFESCPRGDLKGFLISNCDCETRNSLLFGNIPKRMAIEVAAGLEHMHAHGIAHTDLAARNCLVAPDLSIKLGDYGTSIEKYPTDYYVVGHRALPIRWAAPESLNCTDTTIETLEITAKANLWSYAVLLWEIVTWGKRPYDSLCDEEVIQDVLLSSDVDSQSESHKKTTHLLLNYTQDCPQDLYHIMRLCWAVDPNVRPSLGQVRKALETRDFELRWENLRSNMLQDQEKSASLYNLHGSIDSDGWISPHISDNFELADGNQRVLPTSFRLGPEEPVKNAPKIRSSTTMRDSGSETEEESWLDRVKRGAYTEKVRQKSKSVADLMILVHIDSDSDADWSISPQGTEQNKKRLTYAGSDSNLKSTVLADEFTETLKKLRNPFQTQPYDNSSYDNSSTSRTAGACETSDTSNVLTLTTDVEKRPMLRLSSPVIQINAPSKNDSPCSEISYKYNDFNNVFTLEDVCNVNEASEKRKVIDDHSDVNMFKLFPEESSDIISQDAVHSEEHILRLVSKSNPFPPLLRLVPDANDSPEKSRVIDSNKKEESENSSNSNLDVIIHDKDQCAIENKRESVPNISNDWENIKEFAFRDDENSTEEAVECDKDSRNLQAKYFNAMEEPGTDSSLIGDSFKSEKIYTHCPSSCEIDSENGELKYTEIKIPQDAATSADVGKSVTKEIEKMVNEEEKPSENKNLSFGMILHVPLIDNLPKIEAVQQDEIRENNSSISDTNTQLFATILSEQNTPSTTMHQSEYSGDNFLYHKELELVDKSRGSDVTEGREDSKRLSTPDDERSSDSGFRDKESCEEEESPAAATNPLHLSLLAAEEEHLHVISELDAILDAELPINFVDLNDIEESLSPDYNEKRITDLDDPKFDDYTESLDPRSSNDDERWLVEPLEENFFKLLSCNSETEDAKNEVDSLVSNISKFDSQNLIGSAQVAVEKSVESQNSEDVTEIIVPDNDAAVTGGKSDHSNKFEVEDRVTSEDLEYPAYEDGNGSTESLHSDNSYISFGLDEEYVVAIRKELSEKLPHAQMSVEEVPERFETRGPVEESNINLTDHENWPDEEAHAEQGSGVDISIRYNVYNTPLSPILEERETFSIITSESLASKNSPDEFPALKSSESSVDVAGEDMLLVDVATNEAVLVEGDEDPFAEEDKEDQDTSNIDMSDEENSDYKVVMPDSMEEPLQQPCTVKGGSAPLPSPEDEMKWQQLSLSFPLPLQDDLMSTSFTTKHEWDSQDEENSSSSEEFVWKEGERKSPRCGQLDTMDQLHNNLGIEGIEEQTEADEEISDDAEGEGEGEEDEEDIEFTPSAWDASLAPHRSALRSPDKTQRPDQKKSVWFKKQRYHCVYEYPKEASTVNSQEQQITNWEPTSYADWEELMEEPARLDLYPMEYDETDENGEEFYVSSSNRPFQFQTGDGEQVSQFFPGATSSLLQQPDHQQLGELRHTRDRLKLNLQLTESQASSAAPTTSPVEENRKKLADELEELDTLGACKAEINSNKEEAKGTTGSQDVNNEVMGLPPLLTLDNQFVA